MLFYTTTSNISYFYCTSSVFVCLFMLWAPDMFISIISYTLIQYCNGGPNQPSCVQNISFDRYTEIQNRIEQYFPIMDRNSFVFILGDGRIYFMDVAYHFYADPFFIHFINSPVCLQDSVGHLYYFRLGFLRSLF